MSTKGIAADHENWIEQRSIKTRLIFNSTILFTVAINYPAKGEERGDTAVFAGKDTMKQMMCDSSNASILQDCTKSYYSIEYSIRVP